LKEVPGAAALHGKEALDAIYSEVETFVLANGVLDLLRVRPLHVFRFLLTDVQTKQVDVWTEKLLANPSVDESVGCNAVAKKKKLEASTKSVVDSFFDA
jgi:hypothetical protein